MRGEYVGGRNDYDEWAALPEDTGLTLTPQKPSIPSRPVVPPPRKERVYVASSWRNTYQQEVVKRLRDAGYDVYDFKNPRPGDNGFHWSEIDPTWKEWMPQQFINGLNHSIAQRGFNSDMTALASCEICVLVLPSGRSAHIEAGYAAGAGKKVFVLIPEKIEPELMYKMTAGQCSDIDGLLSMLKDGKQ